MNTPQLLTAIASVLITAILGYLAWIWGGALVEQKAFFGAFVACFLVWVLWCVVKP